MLARKGSETEIDWKRNPAMNSHFSPFFFAPASAPQAFARSTPASIRRFPGMIPILSLLVVLLAANPALAGDKKESIAETWAFEGLMTDACQCHLFCPCEFAQKPTYGHCDDTAILHVSKGHYGNVDLSGKGVVVVSQSPQGERLLDTIGKLNFARIYVSDDATDEQAGALAELARRVFGTFVSSKVARISPEESIQKVPMEITIEPAHHAVHIPGILDLDVTALTGWDGKNPVVLKNGPAAGPGMDDILVASSNHYRYTDHGIDWNYDGRSASMRSANLSGRIDQPVNEAPAEAENSESSHHH
jgi:hypothetical protein